MIEEIVVLGYEFRYPVENIFRTRYELYCKRVKKPMTFEEYIVYKTKENIMVQKRKYPEEQDVWVLLSYIKEIEEHLKTGDFTKEMVKKVFIIQDHTLGIAWDLLPVPPNIIY